jgi:hypothetical protein
MSMPVNPNAPSVTPTEQHPAPQYIGEFINGAFYGSGILTYPEAPPVYEGRFLGAARATANLRHEE